MTVARQQHSRSRRCSDALPTLCDTVLGRDGREKAYRRSRCATFDVVPQSRPPGTVAPDVARVERRARRMHDPLTTAVFAAFACASSLDASARESVIPGLGVDRRRSVEPVPRTRRVGVIRSDRRSSARSVDQAPSRRCPRGSAAADHVTQLNEPSGPSRRIDSIAPSTRLPSRTRTPGRPRRPDRRGSSRRRPDPAWRTSDLGVRCRCRRSSRVSSTPGVHRSRPARRGRRPCPPPTMARDEGCAPDCRAARMRRGEPSVVRPGLERRRLAASPHEQLVLGRASLIRALDRSTDTSRPKNRSRIVEFPTITAS